MEIIIDLHIHGRFSRATSKDLTLVSLEKWAQIKGLNLLGTGDFTHPIWLRELKENLSEEGGVLKSKNGFNFILQTELSLIYSQAGKTHRVHNLILAPNFDVVDQINERLGKIGRLDYDGRPIFGISCPELAEMMHSISSEIEIIPAHIWTPWFSIFGSNSGFNSVEECFREKTKYIHCLETGLSSNPAMNYRLSKLDRFFFVSFSDCHSFWPWRLGREATIFDLKEINYKNIIGALRTGFGLKGTIEVDPAYGKYHFDGHRNCNFFVDPTLDKRITCAVCGEKLTIGVLRRVNELADREENYDFSRLNNFRVFKSLIPLSEILAKALRAGIATKSVWANYDKGISSFGNELNILLNVPSEELCKVFSEKIVDLILRCRRGELKIKAGYDGVYGELAENDKEPQIEKRVIGKQTNLNSFNQCN